MPENCLAEDSSERASILLRDDGLIQKGLAQNSVTRGETKEEKTGASETIKSQKLARSPSRFPRECLGLLGSSAQF